LTHKWSRVYSRDEISSDFAHCLRIMLEGDIPQAHKIRKELLRHTMQGGLAARPKAGDKGMAH